MNIPFIDVETDGLDAHNNHLLEIACIVTDSELNVLDEVGFHALVKYEKREVEKMRLNAAPIVQQMHDETGLWNKLWGHTRALSLAEVDARLFKYLRGFGRAGEMPVGGNSVRLDMNFMDKHLPKTAGFLNYQMRDVTTVAGLAKSWYPDLPPFEKYSDHTAMVDIKESIRELKHYRDAVFATSTQADLMMRLHERDRLIAERDAELVSQKREIAELLRRRAAKEAPNAATALRFMAEVIASGKEIPEVMLGEVSETKTDHSELIKELRFLPEFVQGTLNGKPLPLANFTRDRIAKALTDAANALSSTAVLPESITCPKCRHTSFNLNDIREGYCGNCHAWTGLL